MYTRFLTPNDYGVLEGVTMATHITGVVVTLSLAKALSRFYFESKEKSWKKKVIATTYVTYFSAAVACSPFLYIIGSPISCLLFGSEQYSYFFKLSFGHLVAGGFLDIGLMYLRLEKKPKIFISITITRLFCLIALNIYFVVFIKMGVVGILYSSVIVACVYALVITGWILLQTGMKISIRLSWELLKYAFPMVPSKFANDIVKQSDKYFVLQMLSAGDLGIYSLALKLGNSLHYFLTIPFNMAFIPRRFEIMKRTDAKEVYRKIFTYYIFLVGYVGLALSVLIPEVLTVMVTPAFMRAGEYVPIVVFSIILLGSHSHFDFGILYAKQTKYLAYISMTCALLQLSLNYTLVRWHGILGALEASIITLGCESAMLYAIGGRFYEIDYEFKRICGFLLAAGVFYLGLGHIEAGSLWLNSGLKGGGLILFPLVLILLRIVQPKEVEKLKELYHQKIRIRESGETPEKLV
jgi:O-antigen/teichoic acid export membrane protein